MIYLRRTERSISFAVLRLVQDFAKLADAIVGICTLGLVGLQLETTVARLVARRRIRKMK